MQKDKGLLYKQVPIALSLGRLALCFLSMLSGLDVSLASAQQAAETNSVAEEEPRFRWFTTGKVYLRYGGSKPPEPTRLLGFGKYNSNGGMIETSDGFEPYTTRARYIELSNKADGSQLPATYFQEKQQQLFQSHLEPLLEDGDVRLDLYELVLGFEARSAANKKWQGRGRVALDAFELGARLSENDWGGRLVQTYDFDSAGVREAFVSVSRPKVGEIRLGITEGVTRRLDAGASDISSGNGFFGDLSRTPWHVQQLGRDLGQAGSGNFPKIQYFAPKFYGVSIGAEWFSNLRASEHTLASFSRDSSSLCFPSLFYADHKQLFEPNYKLEDEPDKATFSLYDNTKKPFESLLGEDDFLGVYHLQNDLLPVEVQEAGCWQGSSTGSSWHEDVNPSIMGGNIAVAYEKNFPRKKLSFKLAARYGIRSSQATVSESSDLLKAIFTEELEEEFDAAVSDINRHASQLDQAAGFSTGLTWRDYSVFGSVTYQLPSSITLKNLEGETHAQKGVESLSWSVGIKTARLIPHKKGAGGTRKRKGTLSIAFTQAFSKDPRYKNGEQETTFLLHLQSLYPITKNLAFSTNYWYGEAAVSVPFFVTTKELPSQGVLFYERRLVPSHEIAIGLTMSF